MPEYVLEIVEGPEAGRRITLNQPLELGRDPAAGGPLLQDELVSRRHVRITPADDGAQIEDLDSRNGTFVDGDQIYDPAHLAVGGQLLVGVTLLELRPAEEAAGLTSVRAIPASLTQFRALPAENPGATMVRQVPTLAKEEAEPDYVPANALAGGPSSAGALLPLLDTHTKGKARGAPIGIFVLAALAVILYLALR
jgi:pSer/pThr/pTyr-binding forkhead associated (FHA) protein